MKKRLLVSMFLGLFVVSALAATPIKIGIAGPLALPNTDEVQGFDLGLGCNTKENTGIQFGLVYAMSENVSGSQGSWFFAKSETVSGTQGALVTFANEVSGAQSGFINVTKTSLTGVQLGLINYANNMQGFQFGLVNYTEIMEKGLQIGFVNVIKNGKLPIMVIANAKF